MTIQTNREYFDWLVSQVQIDGHLPRTYNGLFERMHETEFVWAIEGDDNRAQDAADLRGHFSGGRESRTPNIDGVTMLELLISLSRKVAFVAGGDPKDWAWLLLTNLGLEQFHDPLTHHYESVVDKILETVITRTYSENGRGGFFPLNNPNQDQTRIEIWQQLNAYVNEIQEPI